MPPVDSPSLVKICSLRRSAAGLCLLFLILIAPAGPLGCGGASKLSMPAIESFTASPNSIVAGSSSTLSWNTVGATSISLTPGSFQFTSSSGTATVSPTATTTYTLTATNSAGSVTATASITVTVPLPKINSFTASPSSIKSGSSSTLSWNTVGATSVAITPGTFTSSSASG